MASVLINTFHPLHNVNLIKIIVYNVYIVCLCFLSFLRQKVAFFSQRVNVRANPFSPGPSWRTGRQDAHSHLLALNDHQDAACHRQGDHHVADLHAELVLRGIQHLEPKDAVRTL